MVNDFHGKPLPEPAQPAGYAALIERYGLRLPLPPLLTAIAQRHHPLSTEHWRLLTPRHAPDATLGGALHFALKWEGVDLAVLTALFAAVPEQEIADIVRAEPTGAYVRRLWFLFEHLTGRTLDAPDVEKVRAVNVIDQTLQYGLSKGALSKRHKVLDNLPGTPAFCPLVRRTAALDAFTARGLDRLARELLGRTSGEIASRAAAFLLLSDSRASFSIEGEHPSEERAARWGRAIGEAGTHVLNVAELERLQRIVIGDARLVNLGLRVQGGFVGMHDRLTREPLPEHISAKPEDLAGLLEGIVSYAQRSAAGGIDPVVTAAAIAFGFVYAHPFEDGNGRIHRWLIQHVLATAKYNPPGVVFPVSAAILREMHSYRAVLESYSKPLLACIDWQSTSSGNVDVLNDTGAYYRYFDATAHAEFLYRCVAQTVDSDLPNEVAYLQNFARFSECVQNVLDMPESSVDLLHRFLRNGKGRLSKRAREREFVALTDDEAFLLEAAYGECFGETTHLYESYANIDKMTKMQ